MDARTFVRNHGGIKTGYTEDVRPTKGSPITVPALNRTFWDFDEAKRWFGIDSD
jgi:hypothetical protein